LLAGATPPCLAIPEPPPFLLPEGPRFPFPAWHRGTEGHKPPPPVLHFTSFSSPLHFIFITTLLIPVFFSCPFWLFPPLFNFSLPVDVLAGPTCPQERHETPLPHDQATIARCRSAFSFTCWSTIVSPSSRRLLPPPPLTPFLKQPFPWDIIHTAGLQLLFSFSFSGKLSFLRVCEIFNPPLISFACFPRLQIGLFADSFFLTVS